jgi:hypothetical protein
MVEDDPDDDLDDSSEDCNDDDNIFSIHSNLSLPLCTVYLSILTCIHTVSLHITCHTAGKIPQTEIFTNFAPNFSGQPKLPRGNLEQHSGFPQGKLKNSLKLCPVIVQSVLFLPRNFWSHDFQS